MHSVEKAGIRGIRRKRNPSQILPGEFFDEGQMLRKEFATLINAPTEDSIVIIPTYNEKENIERIIRKVFSLEVDCSL